MLRRDTTKDGAVGAGLSRTVPQASDQPFAGPDCDFMMECISALRQWAETANLPSKNRMKLPVGPPQPAPTGDSRPPEGRGNSDDGQTIPSAETVAACALAGARGDSIKDGMTVVTAKSVRKSTRKTRRKAAQDGRLGSPGRKRPSIGTKPVRGDARRSLADGEGVIISTVSGSSPPASGNDPRTATSAPDIARGRDMCGHVPEDSARTSQTPKAGEIVYQCREADAEIADLHQVLGLSGGALVCHTKVKVAGETLVACIDTGATFSLLAKTTYDGLRSKLPDLGPPTVFLEGAGGDSLEVAGTVNIDLQLGNENYRQLVQVGLLAGVDLLLGLDWLSTYGVTVDCASRTIKIGVQRVAFGQALNKARQSHRLT